MAKNKTVSVIDDSGDAPEVLASSIKQISAAANKLLGSRLSMRAICVLIKDSAKRRIRLEDIEHVLRLAADLERNYVVKPMPKDAE